MRRSTAVWIEAEHSVDLSACARNDRTHTHTHKTVGIDCFPSSCPSKVDSLSAVIPLSRIAMSQSRRSAGMHVFSRIDRDMGRVVCVHMLVLTRPSKVPHATGLFGPLALHCARHGSGACFCATSIFVDRGLALRCGCRGIGLAQPTPAGQSIYNTICGAATQSWEFASMGPIAGVQLQDWQV